MSKIKELAKLTESDFFQIAALKEIDAEMDAKDMRIAELEHRTEAAEAECVRLDREAQNLSHQLGECDRLRLAAQLKLRELEKQSPVGKQYRVSAKENNSATGWSLWHEGDGEQYRNSYDVEVREVFTRPVPVLATLEAPQPEPVAYTSQANLDALAKKPPKTLEFMTGDKSVYRNPVTLYTESPAPVTPEGWKLVPVEPTEGMVIAGFESEPDESFSTAEAWGEYQAMSGCQQAAYKAKLCWNAMIATAPIPW